MKIKKMYQRLSEKNTYINVISALLFDCTFNSSNGTLYQRSVKKQIGKYVNKY